MTSGITILNVRSALQQILALRLILGRATGATADCQWESQVTHLGIDPEIHSSAFLTEGITQYEVSAGLPLGKPIYGGRSASKEGHLRQIICSLWQPYQAVKTQLINVLPPFIFSCRTG